MSDPIIHVRGLHKTYPNPRGLLELLLQPLSAKPGIRALRGIDLDVNEGQVFGLLGPNGAGKTTFIKILVNLVLPTAGELRIAGHDLSREPRAVRRTVGYVPSDERSFFWRLSGLENLQFFGTLYELPPRESERRIAELMDLFGISKYARQRVGQYSSGRKKLFSIVRGLLGRQPLIVFDEPTNSLDPPAAKHLMDYVRDVLVGKEKRTVVWATHRLEEINDLCEDVMLIDDGVSRFCGSVAAFSSFGRSQSSTVEGLRPLMEVFQELIGSRDNSAP